MDDVSQRRQRRWGLESRPSHPLARPVQAGPRAKENGARPHRLMPHPKQTRRYPIETKILPVGRIRPEHYAPFEERAALFLYSNFLPLYAPPFSFLSGNEYSVQHWRCHDTAVESEE